MREGRRRLGKGWNRGRNAEEERDYLYLSDSSSLFFLLNT